MRLFDCHNHLQDDRFGDDVGELIRAATHAGVARMVVNGSCEADWPKVLELALEYPLVLPSFGYHPWHISERTPEWKSRLEHFLDVVPSAVGEIGLDRWIEQPNVEAQADAFKTQMVIAAERNLPASIHCLKAWGSLHELLRSGPRPECGFLLHSYGGPVEMVVPLARLGAYFSFPGYFLHERKSRQRETFKAVPPDRLLIETDAPDQLPPEESRPFPLEDAQAKPINHPANIGAIYHGLAQVLKEQPESLASRVEANFKRLFDRSTLTSERGQPLT